MTVSKIWLITGSSRGLGRALAESVLAAGEKLIATARDVSQLDDLPRRFGDAVRLVPLDVTDQNAAMNAVDAADSKDFAATSSVLGLVAFLISLPTT